MKEEFNPESSENIRSEGVPPCIPITSHKITSSLPDRRISKPVKDTNNTNTDNSPEKIDTPERAKTRHNNFTNNTRDETLKRLIRPKYDNVRPALLSILGQSSNSTPISSARFEDVIKFGEELIDVMSLTFDGYEGPEYFITIINDAWNSHVNLLHFDIERCKTQLRGFFARRFPGMSATGVLEFQFIFIKNGNSYIIQVSMHAHIKAYGNEIPKKYRSKVYEANRKSGLFKSKLSPHPIYIKTIKKTSDSKHRVSSYLAKLPTKKKVFLSDTKKRSERTLSFKQQMRLLELLSYIPIEKRLFAIGQGKNIRKEIIDGMYQHRRRLADSNILIDEAYLKKSWRKFWKIEGDTSYGAPKLRLSR